MRGLVPPEIENIQQVKVGCLSRSGGSSFLAISDSQQPNTENENEECSFIETILWKTAKKQENL